MGLIFWGGIVPLCVVAIALVIQRPLRQMIDDVRFERARELFRLQREWLEARFVSSLASVDPEDHHRWDDAHWHDEVVWARERPSRHLLALIGVHFDADPIFDSPDDPPRHATALFEFHSGHWHAEGKRLDQTRPDEAFLRHQMFEPVIPHQRRA